MEQTRPSRDARRARRADVRFRIGRWTLAAGAAALVMMWIGTAATSHHSTPWYNDWLVILVLYAVFVVLAMPNLVLGRRDDSGRRPRRPESILRATAAYLVAFFGCAWIFGFPMQNTEVSPIATMTEIDGDEVAIVSYNRVGPRGLLQMAFGIESERVVAVDLATGHHLWDVQTSERAYERPSVLGADEEFVYVENSAGIHALRLSDGSPDETRTPDDEIARAGTTADAAVSGTERIAATETGLVSVEHGTLSTSPDGDAWTALGSIGPNDPDIEMTIVIDPLVHRHSALTVYDDEYWQEEARSVGTGYLVVQEQTYRSWGVYDYRLRTVDLASGRVIDEIEVPESARGGMTAPSGSSIVTLEWPMMSTSDLVIISPEGMISQSTIGRSGFFGEAL